jgi:hypothetical protein
MSGPAQCAEGFATAATTASAGVGLPRAPCTAVPLLTVHTVFAAMLTAVVIKNKYSTGWCAQLPIVRLPERNCLVSKAGWLFDFAFKSVYRALIAKAKWYCTAVMLMLLWFAGYRSVAHYLVLTQQASDATATQQEPNEEAATCTTEPGTAVQSEEAPMLENNNAETSGKFAHMQACLPQTVYPIS